MCFSYSFSEHLTFFLVEAAVEEEESFWGDLWVYVSACLWALWLNYCLLVHRIARGLLQFPGVRLSQSGRCVSIWISYPFRRPSYSRPLVQHVLAGLSNALGHLPIRFLDVSPFVYRYALGFYLYWVAPNFGEAKKAKKLASTKAVKTENRKSVPATTKVK